MEKCAKILFVIVFAAIAGYGVYTNQKGNAMSDLMLANVEALARDEANANGNWQMIPSDRDYREISKQRRVREFCYFYETPFMNEQLLLSTVFYNSKKAMLCADLGKHTFITDVYSGELSFSLSNFNFPIYMDENQVVCLLDQMSYDYFDEKSKKLLTANVELLWKMVKLF